MKLFDNVYLKYLFIFVLSALFSLDLHSQSLNMSEINTSKYPRISANFVAIDGTARPYPNMLAKEFRIWENGVEVSPSIELDCKDSLIDPELAVLLIVDKSGSMKQWPPETFARWDWVKRACTTFVNTIKYVGKTEVAITSFAGKVDYSCPFTNNKQILMDSLDKIRPDGPTFYNKPFLDEAYGAINLLKQKKDIRRVVVFLTDGQPDDPVKRAEIIDSLQNANIQVYTIALLTELNDDLQQISLQTGGKYFPVETEEGLDQVYKLIAIDAQSKSFCTISWLSPFSCSTQDLKKDVEVRFTRPDPQVKSFKTYFVPEDKIPNYEYIPKVSTFGNPPVSVPVRDFVKIIPKAADLQVNSAYIQPLGYFTVIRMIYKGDTLTPPFNVAMGDTLWVEVEFTQKDAMVFRQANLMFDATPCPPNAILYGGVSDVILTKPNGDEIYQTCDDIEVEWSGIDKTTPVNISYTDDDGKTWKSVATAQTGLKYLWTSNKPPVGTKFKVKLDVVPKTEYMWVKSYGSKDQEYGRSIALTNDDYFFYTTGYFSGSFDIGNKTLVSGNDFDIFLAKYNIGGELVWAHRAGGGNSGKDTATGVVVDKNNNPFICGMVQNGAEFGGTQLSLLANTNHFFVAKYQSDGTAPIVRTIGAVSPFTTFQASATHIKYDKATEKITVRGIYNSKDLQIYTYEGKQIPFPSNESIFFATYSANELYLLDVTFGARSLAGYSSAVDTSSDKNDVYRINTYTSPTKIGEFNISPVAKEDYYVSRYGTVKGSSDISERTFTVEKPVLQFIKNTVDLGTLALGVSDSKREVGILKNISLTTVKLDGYTFSAGNTDFSLNTILPAELKANESIDLEFAFNPSKVGNALTTFTLQSSCPDDILLTLKGNGECVTEVSPKEDLGMTNILVTSSTELSTSFRNANGLAIKFNPQIINDAQAEFTIKSIVIAGNSMPLASDIDLPAGEYAVITIDFTPKVKGVRTATLAYNVKFAGCSSAQTELTGIGVSASITAEPLDFGIKRIQTKNSAKLKLKNTSDLPQTVTAINFVNSQNIFSVEVPTNFYTTPIGPKSDVEVTVYFNPQADFDYKEDVKIKILNSTDDADSYFTGIGAKPTTNPELECSQAFVLVGQKGKAKLTLTNTSKFVETTVKSIVSSSPEFTFSSTGNTTLIDQTIPIDSSIDIDLDFAPNTAGNRPAIFEIEADIAIGNNNNENYPALSKDTYESSCEALPAGGDVDVDFGNVLLCSPTPFMFQVLNSGSMEMIISASSKFTGPDAEAFTHSIVNDITVKPKENQPIIVGFQPTEAKTYTSSLIVENSLGQDIKYNFKANVITLPTYSSQFAIAPVEPGFDYNFHLSSDIPKLGQVNINNLEVEIEYNSKMLSFVDLQSQGIDIVNKLTNWTWDTPTLVGNNKIKVTGSGTLPTPYKGDLFTLEYTSYLGDVDSSIIKSRIVLGSCDVSFDDATLAYISGVCGSDFRLLDIPTQSYFMKMPNPNPASEDVTLEFGIAWEGLTKIDLINTVGASELILNTHLKEGVYEITIPVNSLPNGAYLLRFQSGSFNRSEPFVISK